MSHTTDEVFTLALTTLSEISEATTNLRAICKILQAFTREEVPEWATLRVVLAFLAKLGLENCRDIADHSAALQLGLVTVLEQREVRP